MTVRTAAPWVLAIAASVCFGLGLLVLEGLGPRTAALVGYIVLQGASIVLRERGKGQERRWRWPLILMASAVAVVLGFWLGSR